MVFLMMKLRSPELLFLGNNVCNFSGVTALSNNVRFTLAMAKRIVVTNRRITYRVGR